MEKISIYVTVVITILGVAYPILLQSIERLDKKYNSTLIVELFNMETSKKWFPKSLIMALLTIVIWSFQFEPLKKFEGYGYFIDNSASILVFIFTVLLVINFFRLVKKIQVYYTVSKFTKYLINQHSKQNENLIYFNAINAIFIHSIKDQNEGILKTLSRYYYDIFKAERVKQKNQPIEYPDDYYELVYKTIEELAIIPFKKNLSLEYRTAGGVWLLGELQDYEISEKTYS